MSDFLLRSHEVMDSIDFLTAEIEQSVKRSEFNELSSLISRRLELLAGLISLASTDTDKELLLVYLNQFQLRDRVITQSVTNEFEMVKTTLSNLANLKKYVSV